MLWQSPVSCPLHSMKGMARLWLWLDLSTHCINSRHERALGLDQGVLGAGRGGQKVVGWSQRVGLLLVLSLLVGLPENISHFRVRFSCHSYVRLLFLTKEMDVLCGVCERMCMCRGDRADGSLRSSGLCRDQSSKCDWSTWMWLVNLWRIILMCDKRIWLGGIWSLHTLRLCNPAVIRISIFSKHPSDSPWHWRYLPSTILLFFQVLTGVEK